MPLTILIIEDDADAQSNLRDILGLDGHVVIAASTIKEAMEGRSWSEFSVILLDRRLPDGITDSLLPQIQASAPQAAVIVITGNADLDGTITALRHGATDYLLKPINPDLLRAAIARVAKIQTMEKRAFQAERLATIGQMATVLTHESGNILGRGQAILELLVSRVADQPEPLELAADLQKALDDLRRLHEHIRNFAAPIHLDRTVGSIASIWREAWKNLQPIAAQHKKSISLVEHIDGADLTCDTDYFRLNQLFRNFFENSIAACPNPVQVEVACSNTTLHGRPALRIAVRDNGPGLNTEQKAKVFEPFFTTKAKGTGLGMAIAKRIIEAHGGEVTVGNDQDQGAEFLITLPR